MSRVIEIIDSDDDSEAPQHSFPHAVPDQSNEMELEKLKAVPARTESSVANSSAADAAAMALSNGLNRMRNRNRRKSIHQPMRSSPDMQFETIALDDEEELPTAAHVQKPTMPTVSAAGQAAHKPSKPFKTTPKILTMKPPTVEELVSGACEEFTSSDETRSLLRCIAEERVRVNFLLASFGMPDINFSLYTQNDRLQFQLAERLKQRKMRNRGLQESKKRRSLLQTTTQSQGSSNT